MAKLALLGGSPVRTKPFPSWPQPGPEEEAGVLEVLRSGKWFEHTGTKVKAFQEAFAAAQDARFGITTNAGTTAIWLALYAAGVRPGHEVIVPTYTFVSTATAVLLAGATPIFCDVEADTCNLDPTLVEALITPRTKALLPVHFAGYPADMDALRAIADKHGLALVEDAAHAHGSVFKGRKLGAQGDIGAFSFQESKNITAGEGGIVLTNNEALMELCYSVKMYGRIRLSDVWYGHGSFGVNIRMTEMQAAILLAQLARMEEQTQRRWDNARILEQGLSAIPGLLPQWRDDARVTRRSYHLFVFRYLAEHFDGLSRERFMAAMRAEGIPCWSGYGMPLHLQPLFTDRARLAADMPNTRREDGLPPDYAAVETPVAARLCDHEAVWFAQSVLLAEPEAMRDIVNAAEKIAANRHELLTAAAIS